MGTVTFLAQRQSAIIFSLLTRLVEPNIELHHHHGYLRGPTNTVNVGNGLQTLDKYL